MKRNSKKMLALLLAIIIVLVNEEYVGATAGMISGSEVCFSDGKVFGEDAAELSTMDGYDGEESGAEDGTNDGGDVTSGDVSEGETIILFSGALESGVVWEISTDGVLHITGEETNAIGDSNLVYPWHEYKEYFSKCVVDAKKVTNISYWFSDCTNLIELDMSQFDGENLLGVYKVIDNCTNLKVFKTMYNKDEQHEIELPHVMVGPDKRQIEKFVACSESVVINKPVYMGFDNGVYWHILEDKVLYIYGCVTFEWDKEMPWFPYKQHFNKVDVEMTGNLFSDLFDGFDNICEATLNIRGEWTPAAARNMFRGCSQLAKVNVIEFKCCADDYSSMFEGCSNLVSIEGAAFDFPYAKNLSNMFKGCSSLEEIDLSGVKTCESTILDGAFYGCSKLKELDLSNFNTEGLSAVQMLEGCESLSVVKNFKNLKININLPHAMYDAAGTEYIQLPLNVEQNFWLYANMPYSGEVDGLKWMISDTGALHITGVDSSNATSVQSTYPWHKYKDKFSRVFITAQNVKSTAYWFDGCDNIKQISLEDFDPVTVVNMKCMFRGCSNLNEMPDIGLTENVTDFSSMFEGCSSLESINFFETDSATELSNMFKGCTKLTDLYSEYRLNTSNVTNISGMFEGCSSLEYPILPSLDTKNVTNMSNMFRDCGSLSSIRLTENDYLSVKDMSNMFYGCSGMENMYLEDCVFPKEVNMDGFLSGCLKLDKIEMPANLQVDIKLPKEMFDFAGISYKEFFPKGLTNSEIFYAESPAVEGVMRYKWVPAQTYTGKPVKPEVEAYVGTKKLVKNVDYTLSYKNNVNAGDENQSKNPPTILLKGKGNYTGTEKIYFTIEPIPIKDIEVNEVIIKADGKRHLVSPTITYNGKKLVKNKDYKLRYTELEDGLVEGAYILPGTYHIAIEGMGNLEVGERDAYVLITTQPLMKEAKIKAIPKQNYTGDSIEPTLSVTYKGRELVENVDYDVTYKNNVEVGRATAIIEGVDEFIGTKEVTFQIVGQPIAKAKITGIENKVYSGKAQMQDFTVELEGKMLTPEKDYVVEYNKNVNVGKATMLITGKGRYEGTIKKSFKITAYDLATDSLKLIEGVPDNLEVSYEKGGSRPQVNLSCAGDKLVLNKDFSIKYSNNNKIASAKEKNPPTLIIKGKGNFKGNIKIQYTIKTKQLQDAENPLFIMLPDVPYSSKAGSYISKPVITDVNGKKLVAGTDYEKNIVYTLADGTMLNKDTVVEVGQTVYATVTGKGKYEGILEQSYRITPKSFKQAKIDINQRKYTGDNITLSEEDITVKIGDEYLVYGVDYEIVEGSYKNNLKCGNASVTIRGLGEYGGSKTAKFKIQIFNIKIL